MKPSTKIVKLLELTQGEYQLLRRLLNDEFDRWDDPKASHSITMKTGRDYKRLLTLDTKVFSQTNERKELKTQAKKKQLSRDVYCVCCHVMNGAMIAYACNEQTGHSAGTILCADCKVNPLWHDNTQPQCIDCLARMGIICENCLRSGVVKVNAARCSI